MLAFSDTKKQLCLCQWQNAPSTLFSSLNFQGHMLQRCSTKLNHWATAESVSNAICYKLAVVTEWFSVYAKA